MTLLGLFYIFCKIVFEGFLDSILMPTWFHFGVQNPPKILPKSIQKLPQILIWKAPGRGLRNVHEIPQFLSPFGLPWASILVLEPEPAEPEMESELARFGSQGSVWDHFDIVLGSFRDDLGICLGSF